MTTVPRRSVLIDVGAKKDFKICKVSKDSLGYSLSFVAPFKRISTLYEVIEVLTQIWHFR